MSPLRHSVPGVPASRRGTGEAAFTLIEMVGVLVVMTILAAVVAENVIGQIKQANRDAEADNLQTFADGLRRSILHTRSVPGTNNWDDALVTELALPLNRITLSSAGNARVLVLDPAFRVGTNSASVPPYTQTRDGSTNPVSPRAILLASVSQPLPALTIDAASFSNLWYNAPADTAPSGWPAAWAKTGKDLKIVRMDWSGLFHRVVLANADALRNAPYSIDSTNTRTFVPAGGQREAWFLHGTPINLHYYPIVTATNSEAVLGREYVVEDMGYVFENGCWRRYATAGVNVGTSPDARFGQWVDTFLLATANPARVASASQQSVIDAMRNYLLYMATYAQNGSPSDSATPPQTPDLRMAYDAQLQLSLVSSNLTK
jgi:type II secretory pathway pseudopilin PulG